MVHFFFRKRLPNYNSIEEVFEKVFYGLDDRISFKTIKMPKPSNSIFNILINLYYARRNRGRINHITGDVYYLGWILPKSNTIITVHDIYSTLKYNGIKNKLIKYFWYTVPLNRAKCVTTISEFSKREIVTEIGLSEDKIKVVHNSVSEYEYQIRTPRKVGELKQKYEILLLGTKPNKNLERIIPALQDLNVKLHIVGKLKKSHKRLLELNELEFENYFNIPYKEVIELYRKCDVLCFPSLYEGFGMPIIEAQALGVPVITSDIGAMKEVAGDSACLVNPYDEKAIRYAVIKMLDDDAYRKALIEKGRENIKRFEPEKIAEEYLEVYKSMEKGEGIPVKG